MVEHWKKMSDEIADDPQSSRIPTTIVVE